MPASSLREQSDESLLKAAAQRAAALADALRGDGESVADDPAWEAGRVHYDRATCAAERLAVELRLAAAPFPPESEAPRP